jgi:transcriptional regulator
MYLRSVHAENSIPILRQLIRSNPLGILTTAITSKHHPTILSSHIPFILDVQDESSEIELGVLRGHIARANPQSKSIVTQLESQAKPSGSYLEEEVLVLFTASVHHYVTPKFYIKTKPDTGKVVPTWNYAAAQAYGHAKIYFDSKAPETGAFLSKQIRALSQYAEEYIMGFDGQDENPKAWEVDDAPGSYVGLLQKAIIGIEIDLERLEGKFKMSQELHIDDREGVVKGFEELGNETALGVAGMVKEKSPGKPL